LAIMTYVANKRALERRAQDNRRRAGRRCRGVAVLAGVWMWLVAPGHAAAADPTPGGVLRQYLQARLRGDLQAAQSLWDPRDVRRATAMGIRWTGVAAGFDDYWFLDTAAERQRAAGLTAVVGDSVAESNTQSVRFTVFLREASSGAVRDTLCYSVQNDGGTWRVSLPYLQATRSWTRREGRFFRLRAKRLARVSSRAMQELDNTISAAFAALGTPETAQLRLERVKLEYYLCDDAADVRMLVGSTRRAGYLPGGQRVVTEVSSDLSAVTRVALDLTLRTPPARNVGLIETGLGAALGGTADLSADVLVQRARFAVARKPALLDAAFTGSPGDSLTTAMTGLWCRALLLELGPKGFVELARGLGGTAQQVAARTPAEVRGAIEKATGKTGDALTAAVRQRVDSIPLPLRGGCDRWPRDIHGLQPILTWRDAKEEWGLFGYEIGDDYTISVCPYEPGPPEWMRNMVDSLQVLGGGEKRDWKTQPVIRPKGDPPRISVLVRARLEEDVEAYESALFARHFLAKNFKNDLYGLFITPDSARLYDYSQNKLIGEYSAKDTPPPAGDPPGGLVYYDEKLGHICCRFHRDLLPRGLAQYFVFLSVYTGE
jgi:hypothetical protein